MAIYPTPNSTDLVDIETTFSWINNSASGGIFFPIILLTIWIIVFVGSIAEGRKVSRAWVFANFVSILLAVIMGLLGWLQPAYIYFLIILLAFGLVMIKLTGAK